MDVMAGPVVEDGGGGTGVVAAAAAEVAAVDDLRRLGPAADDDADGAATCETHEGKNSKQVKVNELLFIF